MGVFLRRKHHHINHIILNRVVKCKTFLLQGRMGILEETKGESDGAESLLLCYLGAYFTSGDGGKVTVKLW
jgi:hypothetical protein